ncbi:C-type lectin domain family 2 member A [Rhinolophus ferrumequinum]|nr:C-type lectin domain family 2 member A [Rhinolophus ferrumequinum]
MALKEEPQMVSEKSCAHQGHPTSRTRNEAGTEQTLYPNWAKRCLSWVGPGIDPTLISKIARQLLPEVGPVSRNPPSPRQPRRLTSRKNYQRNPETIPIESPEMETRRPVQGSFCVCHSANRETQELVHQLKKYLIFSHIVFILFIFIILSVFVVKLLKYPKTMECSGEWIGVREKCFYFSDDTRNWTASKRVCSSQGSELAHIDTQEDMEFLKKHTGTKMHWIGLSRKPGESWKWTNGTTFNAWFEITGDGSFAFLNADGVYSSRGFVDIKWICSKPRF